MKIDHQPLLKAHVRAHTRKTTSGAVTQVRAHEDKRRTAQAWARIYDDKNERVVAQALADAFGDKHVAEMWLRQARSALTSQHGRWTVDKVTDVKVKRGAKADVLTASVELRTAPDFKKKYRAQYKLSLNIQRGKWKGEWPKMEQIGGPKDLTAEERTTKRKLEPGQAIRGPEPLGNFGTGTAPTIGRSKVADVYIVGPELSVREAFQEIRQEVRNMETNAMLRRKPQPTAKEIAAMLAGTRLPGDRPDNPLWAVTIYPGNKTAAAFKHFEQIKAERIASNEADLRKIAELKKQAAKGDVGAALELGDYGVMSGGFLGKAHVKAHTRRTKSGKVVAVQEHEDSRAKKIIEAEDQWTPSETSAAHSFRFGTQRGIKRLFRKETSRAYFGGYRIVSVAHPSRLSAEWINDHFIKA